MKRLGLLIGICLAGVLSVGAQNIVKSLEQDVPGQGRVRIHQDPRITRLIGAMPVNGERKIIKATGYRIQVYAGNFLDGTLRGKRGIAYGHRASVCLETQKYPDTPNKPQWPSALLRPGEQYDSHCIFKFSIGK